VRLGRLLIVGQPLSNCKSFAAMVSIYKEEEWIRGMLMLDLACILWCFLWN